MKIPKDNPLTIIYDCISRLPLAKYYADIDGSHYCFTNPDMVLRELKNDSIIYLHGFDLAPTGQQKIYREGIDFPKIETSIYKRLEPIVEEMRAMSDALMFPVKARWQEGKLYITYLDYYEHKTKREHEIEECVLPIVEAIIKHNREEWL